MSRRLKKTVVRQDVILSHLRERIVSGRLQPGRRMPAVLAVVKKFDSSPLTVARVFRRLQTLGFVRIEPGVGTFVADHPPHQFRYALIFPNHPGQLGHLPWTRFFSALSAAAEEINRAGARQVKMYFDCTGHIDGEEFQILLRDASARTLAGLMFAFTPHELLGSEIFEIKGLPQVAVGAPAEWRLPVVGHDYERFYERALDLLQEQGRQRVAIVMPPIARGLLGKLGELVRRRGMTTLPFWMQAVAPEEPAWARHAVHAILHSEHHLVPDALIVTDDHLVEAVADALIEFGVRVPEDLTVVGHWNFPLPYTRDIPIQRLGWDAKELLEKWMDTIDAQRRGETVPRHQTISGRAEHTFAESGAESRMLCPR